MNVPLLKLADSPATSVASATSVADAVRSMIDARVGAVAVIDDDKLKGIFTERDLMTRVVGEARDPSATTIADVMVSDPVSVTPETKRSDALDLMVEKHFRHLPIVDVDGRLLGMLSIRNLLSHQVERLSDSVTSLEQYLAADGPGG